MQQYKQLIQDILSKGTYKSPAREGMAPTIGLFGYQMRFNLAEGFPIVTTKPIHWKSVVYELLWFLRGDTNIKFLVDNGVSIWNEDAYNYYCKKFDYHYPSSKDSKITFETFMKFVKDEDVLNEPVFFDSSSPVRYYLGDCGQQYGKLWRDWQGVDQFSDLVKGLIKNPEGRRHIITAWNPSTLNDMALNACHAFVQFNCRKLTFDERCAIYIKTSNHPVFALDIVPITEDELEQNSVPKYYLDCHLYQRSADTILGVPFNISSYALLTYIVAELCGFAVGEFIHSFGDVHIYENHIDAAKETLDRECFKLPTLALIDFEKDDSKFEKFGIHNFHLIDYKHHPKLKSPTKLSTGLK